MRRTALVVWIGVCAWLALALVVAASSEAAIGFEPGSFRTTLSSTQAGAHPNLDVRFTISRDANGEVSAASRRVDVDLPAGVVGNATAIPRCTFGQVIAPFSAQACSREAAVGYLTAAFRAPNSDGTSVTAPVFNIEPGPDHPASFAAFPLRAIRFDASVRADGDYAIRATAMGLPEGVKLANVRLVLFGVPADQNGPGSISVFPSQTIGGRGPGERKPFLSNPTACGGPLISSVSAVAWGSGGSASDTTSAGVIGGCDRLSFEPSLDVQPDTSAPGAASGYRIDVGVPQRSEPDGLASPTLRNADVTLPPGLTIAPGAASGLQGCPTALLGLKSDALEQCPAASKVGETSITSPLLPGPITGNIYVGQPEGGNRYRLFLVAAGYGVRIKLEGRVDPDPVTGQLKASFKDNPQLPFSNLRLDLFGGARAILANPTTCGAQTATGSFTSHAGQSATPSGTFSIACPGIGSFAPAFSAGSDNPVAGTFSDFGVKIDRTDSDQFLSGVSVNLPTGLLARLRGVSVCADVNAAAGNCSAASRVGTATVGAGPGPNPFYLKGTVSLGGAYKGAPYSLVVAVRAIAGPFDLGTVVVRQALFVDRRTTQVRAVSDPLPTILEGIPLRLRSVAIDLDRPGFTVNPTSCAEKRVTAALGSTAGASSSPSSRFQVAGCRGLDLEPKLALRLSGGASSFRDGGHPSLKAILTQPDKQSNLKQVSVELPKSLALDPDNANGLCEYEDSLKADPACPKSSIVGRARVRTRLLDKPLAGPVYFAKNIRINRFGRRVRTLPRLVIALRGQLAINLIGDSSIRKGTNLVTTFKSVPDAAVGRFDLVLNGGGSGVLVANTRVCNVSRDAVVQIDGHNGKSNDAEREIAASRCSK